MKMYYLVVSLLFCISSVVLLIKGQVAEGLLAIIAAMLVRIEQAQKGTP